MKIIAFILFILFFAGLCVYVAYDNTRADKKKAEEKAEEKKPGPDEIVRGAKAKRAFNLINRKPCYMFALNKTNNTVLVGRSRNEANAKWIPADKLAPFKQRRQYK